MTPQQNTQEWIEFRRNKIGSSDAPIIMGKSPWKTPYQLWEEKLGIRDYSYESPAMKRGKELEAEARKAFERQTGVVVWPDVLIHPTHDFIIASMDGVSMDGTVAVEIKCPGEKTHKMAINGEIPEHYQIQMQHQMAVTGHGMMFYYSFDGSEGALLEVKRDDKFIRNLLKRELEFYQSMKEFRPPINERIDEAWGNWADEWKEVQGLKKTIEQREKECREALIDLAGENNAEGCGVRVTHYTRKGRVIYEKIPELQGMDLDPYRQHPVKTWKITATG